MAPAKRNLLVGTTVLGAFLVLGWMIIQFGGSIATPFAAPVLNVSFTTTRADGVVEGSPIMYRGVNVGKVTKVSLLPDNENVDILAQINRELNLPANVQGTIRQTNVFGGGAAISLDLTNGQPEGQLADGAKLQSRFAGSGLIPPEIAELASDLRETSRQFRESNVVPNMNAQLTKIGTLIEELTNFVTDTETQDNLRKSLANVRTATESANRITANFERFSAKLESIGDNTDRVVTKAGDSVDDLSKQLTERMSQISQLLHTTQSIAAKIDKGEGTAGRLVNDPKLYAGLVETTESLNLIVRDMQRLVQQWEQEGVSLKLK
ncbi:MAG TPA: MlaD family protein [Tepidisphaeraceae bacterium]|jgi:phospholipid/cholesterol/gamma-HCH transport system substrate-binding protein|nr:MlaD family protein [Tepidisphaeraceae bacterium]